MIAFTGHIPRSKFVWDLSLFHKIRDWADGMSFLGLTISLDRFQADHNPNFKVHLVVLNWTLVEFDIYNPHHLPEDVDSDGPVRG